jgi:fibronectin type 3 domain-containing protein
MKEITILLSLLFLFGGCALDRSNPLDPVEHDISVPKEVIGIKVSHSSSSKIDITWATQDDADGYFIYRSMSIYGHYARIDNDLLNSSEADAFIDDNIITGNWYYYKMSAYCWVDNRRLEGRRSGPKTW